MVLTNTFVRLADVAKLAVGVDFAFLRRFGRRKPAFESRIANVARLTAADGPVSFHHADGAGAAASGEFAEVRAFATIAGLHR